MQPSLPTDTSEPPVTKVDRCGIWACENPRQPGGDYCIAHTTPPAQRACPRCIEEGRGRGAVFMASGVAVCGSCGWGRNRVPKSNAGARKAAKNKQRRR